MVQETNRNQQSLALYQQAQLNLIEEQHKLVRVQFINLLQNDADRLNPEFVTEAKQLMLQIKLSQKNHSREYQKMVDRQEAFINRIKKEFEQESSQIENDTESKLNMIRKKHQQRVLKENEGCFPVPSFNLFLPRSLMVL